MQPTRWLIEPHGKVRLLLKFFSEEPSSAGCYRSIGILLPLADRRVRHNDGWCPFLVSSETE